MSEENDLTSEESAFPIVCFNTAGMPNVLAHGMTLRDWFAGQALAGLQFMETSQTYGKDAEQCYLMADAMLKARKQ